MSTNQLATQGLDMSTYLVDIRETVIPNASTASASAPWLNTSKVFMPLHQKIEMTIAEHLNMSAELRRAIQVAYVQGLWPNFLHEDKLRMRQLTGLAQLSSHANYPVFQAAQQKFLDAAAQAATLAQAGNVEGAFAALTGQYETASQELVLLLQAGMPRFARPSARSLPALPA